ADVVAGTWTCVTPTSASTATAPPRARAGTREASAGVVPGAAGSPVGSDAPRVRRPVTTAGTASASAAATGTSVWGTGSGTSYSSWYPSRGTAVVSPATLVAPARRSHVSGRAVFVRARASVRAAAGT